jgi:hypothetical protein
MKRVKADTFKLVLTRFKRIKIIEDNGNSKGNSHLNFGLTFKHPPHDCDF